MKNHWATLALVFLCLGCGSAKPDSNALLLGSNHHLGFSGNVPADYRIEVKTSYRATEGPVFLCWTFEPLNSPFYRYKIKRYSVISDQGKYAIDVSPMGPGACGYELKTIMLELIDLKLNKTVKKVALYKSDYNYVNDILLSTESPAHVLCYPSSSSETGFACSADGNDLTYKDFRLPTDFWGQKFDINFAVNN